MTLAMPSLELPGIIVVGLICFVAGAMVGSSAMVSLQAWRKKRA